MFWLLWLLVSVVHAQNYLVTECAKFNFLFEDVGAGDNWTTNQTRSFRGIYIEAVKESTGTVQTGGYADEDGCRTLGLPIGQTYTIRVQSTAQVNGVTLRGWTTSSRTAYLTPGVLRTGYLPSANDQLTDTVPDTYGAVWRALAVGGYMMWRNNAGIDTDPSPHVPLDFTEGSGCCSGAVGGTHLITNVGHTHNKWDLSHEIGHMIAYRRNGSQEEVYAFDADTDHCDADELWFGPQSFSPTTVHDKSPGQKDFQSIAAREGFADFVAEWAWNDSCSNCDCTFGAWFTADFDLDGDYDNDYPGSPVDLNYKDGWTDCEGILAPTTDPKDGDTLSSYVTAKDWLEDLDAADDDNIDGYQCHDSRSPSTLANRGTSMDWRRFWWDVITDHAGVNFIDAVDIYDHMDGYAWETDDGNGDSAGTDRVYEFLEDAMDAVTCFPGDPDPSCHSVWLAEKDHGVER